MILSPPLRFYFLIGRGFFVIGGCVYKLLKPIALKKKPQLFSPNLNRKGYLVRFGYDIKSGGKALAEV